MVDALFRQQAATPIAFHHPYLTPFSFPGLAGMSPCTCWKNEDILGSVKQRALLHRLIWVELPSEALLGHP